MKEFGQVVGKEVARREESTAKKQLVLEVSSKDGMTLDVPPPPPMYAPSVLCVLETQVHKSKGGAIERYLRF